MVGYPEVIHSVRSPGCPETRLLRSSRGPLAAILPLFPRHLQTSTSSGGRTRAQSSQKTATEGRREMDLEVFGYGGYQALGEVLG